MNKKIKIYSTIFIVTIILVVVTNNGIIHYNHGYSVYSESMDTLELVDEPAEFVSVDTISSTSATGPTFKTTHHPVISYVVNIMPNHTPGEKVLISKAFGQTYKVNMKRVELQIPAEAKFNSADKYEKSAIGISNIICSGICTVISLFIILWILVIVFKTIRSIRRGEVFVSQVSKYIERSGILLVALYVVDFIGSLVLTMIFADHIHIAGYHVVFVNGCNHMYLITGFALMIISQIILMGKELKEDQELTI